MQCLLVAPVLFLQKGHLGVLEICECGAAPLAVQAHPLSTSTALPGCLSTPDPLLSLFAHPRLKVHLL